MKATASANANIALIKYWGKRNEELILPQNSSVSVTLEGLKTVTTVDFDKKYKKDNFTLNGKKISGEPFERIAGFLNIIRKMAGSGLKAKIFSKNFFPTATGLASSSAGGATLALASSKAIGLDLNKKGLSLLARRNSGSASRSIEAGFVEWEKGEKEDGTDSFGKQVCDKDYWPEFRIIAGVLNEEEKKTKSRPGMKQSVQTCPFYKVWVENSEKQAKQIKKFILEKKFTKLGELAENNALMLHSVMFNTILPIVYFSEKTVEMIKAVRKWRASGLECYFTIDAGPQVKIICLEKDIPEIKRKLKGIKAIKKIYICKPGDGARLINKHLF